MAVVRAVDRDGRRLDDEELAVVLRRAVDLERRGHRTAPAHRPSTAGGFSLAEVRAIAAEAGIDAGAVEQALRSLGEAPPSTTARLAGGPFHMRREVVVAGRLGDERRAGVVGRIRREASHHGVVVPEPGSLVWRSTGQPTQLDVVAEPVGDATRITVTADRSGAAALTMFGSFAAWLAAAGVTGAALDPTGTVGAAVILGSALIGGAVTARVLWSRASRRMRDRVDRLVGAVEGGLEPPEDGPG